MSTEEEEIGGGTGGKVLFFLFTAVFLAYFVYKCGKSRENEEEVLAGYHKTTGWIVSYWDRHNSDAGSGRTIEYGYRVGEKNYSRSVYTHALFEECDGDLSEDCRRKRFWVIYSHKDSAMSLINLTIEIQDAEDPECPGNLDDFI